MAKQVMASLGMGLMLTLSASASETGRDAALRQAAEEALRSNPYLGVFDYVTVEVDGGYVRLGGFVEQKLRREAAAARIAQLPGVEEISNEITVQSQAASDVKLRRRLYEKIYYGGAMPGGSRPEWPVRIQVSNGCVTLAGQVASSRDRERLEAMAWQAGAQLVENQLHAQAVTIQLAADRK